MLKPKYNNKNNVILMGFDTIEINLVHIKEKVKKDPNFLIY